MSMPKIECARIDKCCFRIHCTFPAYNIDMNKLKLHIIVGIIFVLITGTISHFIYEWFDNNFILGFFFPVNESTWEHMKLCFFPMLFYSLYMNQKLKYDYPCVTSSLLFGVLLGTFLIPILFYTYSGILGRNITFLDVSTFILSVLLAFFTVYKLTLSCKMAPHVSLLKSFILIVAICFFIFTYRPLDINIFREPNVSSSLFDISTF